MSDPLVFDSAVALAPGNPEELQRLFLIVAKELRNNCSLSRARAEFLADAFDNVAESLEGVTRDELKDSKTRDQMLQRIGSAFLRAFGFQGHPGHPQVSDLEKIDYSRQVRDLRGMGVPRDEAIELLAEELNVSETTVKRRITGLQTSPDPYRSAVVYANIAEEVTQALDQQIEYNTAISLVAYEHAPASSATIKQIFEETQNIMMAESAKEKLSNGMDLEEAIELVALESKSKKSEVAKAINDRERLDRNYSLRKAVAQLVESGRSPNEASAFLAKNHSCTRQEIRKALDQREDERAQLYYSIIVEMRSRVRDSQRPIVFPNLRKLYYCMNSILKRLSVPFEELSSFETFLPWFAEHGLTKQAL